MTTKFLHLASWPIYLGNQHGQLIIVLEHRYGRFDFMRKGSIETVMYLWVSGFHEAISSKGYSQNELRSFRCKMKSFRSIIKSAATNFLNHTVKNNLE